MATETKATKKAAKTLHRMQGEQIIWARQMSGLRRKLEKRGRQLQTLEVKMGRLERLAFGPGPDGQPVAASRKTLRPARLIINPESGSFARLAESPEKLVALLRTHGILAEVYLKTSTKAVHAWVQEAVKQHEALVIAVGGDGTIEDVAVGLVGSQTVLGILPTGSMNNLARELGIPLDLEQACALIGAGITRQIDVGQVRCDGRANGSYFLESAGLGVAVALPAGQNVKKGRWGKLPAAFRKLFERNPAPIEIELDNGEVIQTQVQLVTVSNAPLLGLNNLIAPEAKMDDGLLDLAVYDGLSDIDLAGYFLQNANGQRVSNPNVRFYRTRRVQIRSTQVIPAMSDKDELPDRQVLDFELIPRAINVIVGQGSGLVWPVDAVTSVPPLAGEQAPPRNVIAAEAPKSNNGKVHDEPQESPQQPGTAMIGAR